MNSEELVEAFSELEKTLSKLQGGPLSYYIKCLTTAHDLLINKYAPFKKGDKVLLIKEVDFVNDAPGWITCKHFLKPGAKGVVECVSVHSKGYLVIGVIFDNETYLSSNGKEEPITRKHVFNFSEKHLVLDYTND